MYAFFYGISRAMAYVGGLMLTALIVITCVSILGRSANSLLHSDLIMGLIPGVAHWLIDLGVGPVNGDYELVEAGVAFSIFAFLPLCQITGGHASVDVFTNLLTARTNRNLLVAIDILFAVVLTLIAVQLYEGTMSKVSNGETSLLLQFPVWWAYALSLTGAAAAGVISIYIAIMRIAEALTGRTLLPSMSGADH